MSYTDMSYTNMSKPDMRKSKNTVDDRVILNTETLQQIISDAVEKA